MEDRILININKENKTIKQFVKLCRIALKYEKVNYYSERKRMAERESHIEMFSEKQLEMIDKVFDTYHADYFQIMGYEIGIVDGEMPDRQMQIVLMYYLVGLKDREIGEIFGLAKSSVCKLRHDAIKILRRLMEELYYG